MRKLVYFIAASLDGFIAIDSDTDPTGTVFDVEGDHLPR